MTKYFAYMSALKCLFGKSFDMRREKLTLQSAN